MTAAFRPAQRNWGARIRDGEIDGMRMVTMENELLRVGVLAGKGTDIVELLWKPRDLDFVWLAPGGVRNPARGAGIHRDSLGTFVDAYPGGWQEVFPNGGAPSHHDGASYGQHDEVFALPWDVAIVEDDAAIVVLRFTVRCTRLPCTIEKTISLERGAASLRIDERVTNTGAVPVRAMWGQHITFGAPFMRPGHRITLPGGLTATPHASAIAPGGRRVAAEPFRWPHGTTEDGDPIDLSVIPPPGTPSDIVYITGFPDGEGRYAIHDPDTGVGARVTWDAETMPWLWYWQEFGGTRGYPWYGQVNVVGLEPWSSQPTDGLAAAVENGTALEIAPGEQKTFWLTYGIEDPAREEMQDDG